MYYVYVVLIYHTCTHRRRKLLQSGRVSPFPPLFSPALPLPPPPSLLPPLPLEVGPLLRLRGWGGAQAPLAGPGRSSAAKYILVRFELKSRHLVASILMSFPEKLITNLAVCA